MLDQNYISQDEYNNALNDDVYSRIQAAQLENTEEESTVYTYFEDEVTNQVISDLMNIKGYTKTQATNLLYSGGLKIMTTLDSNIQQILDEEYANPDNYPADVQYELDYALTVQDADGNQKITARKCFSFISVIRIRNLTFSSILRKRASSM